MKRLLVFSVAVAVLLAACGTSDSAPDLSNAAPGEKVTLSDLSTDFVPQAVVPYGAEPDLVFTGLDLTRKGDNIQGAVDFTRQGQDDFTLVVYLTMADEVLIGYLDAGQKLTLNLPGGGVAFGVEGYELSGNDTGSIEFSVPAKVYGGFDVSGEKGTAFVFAVPGTVNPRSTLPGEQTDPETYQANSNVIEIGFSF